MYGGFGPQQLVYEDMYCLDLATCTWEKVQQDGAVPDRQLGKHKSFHAAVLAPAGHAMLAFGFQRQVCVGLRPSLLSTISGKDMQCVRQLRQGFLQSLGACTLQHA